MSVAVGDSGVLLTALSTNIHCMAQESVRKKKLKLNFDLLASTRYDNWY